MGEIAGDKAVRRRLIVLAIAAGASQVNAQFLVTERTFMAASDPRPARYDVVAIGNAIVDLMAPCGDELIGELGMERGGMTLIDTARANELYDAMGPAREISGGSAANTLAGLSALGAQCAFVGQVAQDQLGDVFAHDIHAVGIDFDVPARAGDPPTARCLIFVTPDGQRTMNTYLGATQFLPAEAVDEALIASASVLYLEGYLWDPEEPRKAMRRAIAAARGAGRQVAFTLSDPFVISRHGDDFRQLLDEGQIERRAPTFPPSRSPTWSTPPARATYSPPGSSTATCVARASSGASSSGRCARQRSSRTSARGRRRTYGRWRPKNSARRCA